MPKLYFRYGTMSSSKTANMLMVAHNYQSQNKKIITIKPKIDNRYGDFLIKSRCGLEKIADIVLYETDDIPYIPDDVKCILVDEANFLTERQIEQLRQLTKSIPVICYGLRTDFKGFLFPGSKRLMELADTIEEIKTTCTKCNKKSIINAKYSGNHIVKTGNSIDIGGDDKYMSLCWGCWDLS